MYPGTQFNWFDQSEILQPSEIAVLDNKPLLMVVSSFDKGPEKLMEVEGTTFNSLFGTMSFERHGQNSIQAQRIIEAGGKLLVKRVVAPDSTIANVVLTAKLTDVDVQQYDARGNTLYLDADGNQTTEKTDTPYTVPAKGIHWGARYISGCKTFEEVKSKVEDAVVAGEFKDEYPLMIFTDNGRGSSSKAIRIIPDYNTSKGIGKMFYNAAIFEGTSRIETSVVTLDPVVIYQQKSYGIDKNSFQQVRGEVLESFYDSFVSAVADELMLEVDVVRNYDLIYGYNSKGSSISGLVWDETGIDLNTEYGIVLKEGTNGVFGDKPVNTDAWAQEIIKVYRGEVTDEVWDVDQHKVAAVCDANFPVDVKEAIADWVNFRKDCIFFRDLGTGLNTFLEIKAAYEKNPTRSRYIADYATSYEVKDPNTKKNIEVTMMYDFVECLVNHLDAGPHNPLAGVINRFILRDAIKGTINYTPIITPSVNQKQAMEDIRVNYAIFEDDNCVVQTLYTSQDAYTQLSFVNNVMAIQEVARAVRTACPKNRYALVSNSDMTSYAKAVNNVLSNFNSNFDILQFEYQKDPLKASQKIFYATIKFAFKQWAQTEIFDLFAINNN